MNLNRVKIFNGNSIKLLAAALMLIDHIGYLLLPNIIVLRYIGRVSMPLFAFMIAEGCRYTKNKTKHLAMMFLLGVVCQIVYYIFDGGSLYMSILITFSLSIAVIYAMQYCKKCIFNGGSAFDITLSALLLIAVIFLVWAVNQINNVNGHYFYIDYGFWGCMLPAFASLFDFRNINLPACLKSLDNYYLRLVCFAIGLVVLCATSSGSSEWYALIALVPLALYNGQKGKLPLKYFFYVFYPAHLVLLEFISMLI